MLSLWPSSMSHRLIHFLPRKFTLSGSPIHVARFPAAPFPRARFLCLVRPLHAADGKERLAYSQPEEVPARCFARASRFPVIRRERPRALCFLLGEVHGRRLSGRATFWVLHSRPSPLDLRSVLPQFPRAVRMAGYSRCHVQGLTRRCGYDSPFPLFGRSAYPSTSHRFPRAPFPYCLPTMGALACRRTAANAFGADLVSR